MVSSSKVRIICPSVSFLFIGLGASLGVSYSFSPLIKGFFFFKGNSLSVVLAELFPLLRQSVVWFENLASEQRVMSDVRYNELETGLSSSDDPVEVEEDTTASSPRQIKAFRALGKVCGLDAKTLSRFRERFQFPERVRVCLPYREERACHFSPREVCFYEATFLSGLKFPIYPFIMELLGHFDIAPGQLMPNSWGIVVSYMEIWLATTEGDMIKVDELVYFYRLKGSKEHGYYKLVPWEKMTRIVRDLPSSFKYWKSRFFFVSEDEWETPSDEVWGDLPKLLRRWKTPSLGAS